jgi:hypothetical protein
MKRRIDLEKAAESEAFGALARRVGRKHRSASIVGRYTPAQTRALFDLVQSLLQVAREAGAEQKRVTVGAVSLKLQENGAEEILSIRTAAGT